MNPILTFIIIKICDFFSLKTKESLAWNVTHSLYLYLLNLLCVFTVFYA